MISSGRWILAGRKVWCDAERKFRRRGRRRGKRKWRLVPCWFDPALPCWWVPFSTFLWVSSGGGSRGGMVWPETGSGGRRKPGIAAGSVLNTVPNWSGDLSCGESCMISSFLQSHSVSEASGIHPPAPSSELERRGSSVGQMSWPCPPAAPRTASPGDPPSRRPPPGSRRHCSHPSAEPAPPCDSRRT